MLQIPIRHATRWVLIGLIGIFAIGGSPGIAAACEGIGEEVVLESTAKEGEKGLNNTIPNPFHTSVKIVEALKPHAGAGAITNEGNCKVGELIAAMGSCAFTQNAPLGASLRAVFD